jgi:hypothetical protein
VEAFIRSGTDAVKNLIGDGFRQFTFTDRSSRSRAQGAPVSTALWDGRSSAAEFAADARHEGPADPGELRRVRDRHGRTGRLDDQGAHGHLTGRVHDPRHPGLDHAAVDAGAPGHGGGSSPRHSAA